MKLERVLNSAAGSIATAIGAGALSLLLLTSPGCVRCNNAKPITKELQAQCPRWNSDAIMYKRVKDYNGKIVFYGVSIEDKSPFCRGFSSYQTMMTPGEPFGELGLTLADQFDGFTNFYAYKGWDIIGAVTLVNSICVAEARVKRIQEQDETGSFTLSRQVEEFHYDKNGKLIFHCFSKIDPLGFKQSEFDVSGRKQHEYYSVLPSDR